MKVVLWDQHQGNPPMGAGTPSFKIDRSSPIGNPFLIGRDGGREEVCDKYQAWFIRLLDKDLEEDLRILPQEERALDYLRMILQAVEKNSVVYLLCWCPPNLQCHGLTIIHWLRVQGLEFTLERR